MQVIAISEASVVAVILGAMTLVATLGGAWMARGAKAQATAANKAVNDVPPGTPPISQRVAAIEATQVQHGHVLDRLLDIATRPDR